MIPHAEIASTVVTLLIIVGASLAAAIALLLGTRAGRHALHRLRADARDLLPGGVSFPVGPIALLCGAAAAVRLLHITRPVRTDEAATYLYYVDQPLTTALAVYGSPNNHLLHTLLASASTTLFGDGIIALRLAALLFGIALVPATAFVALILFRDRSASIAAAALAAGWPYLIDYSANARGYTILAVAATILFAMTLRLIDHPENLAASTLFIVAISLGMFTIPVMAYPAAVAGTALAVDAITRDDRRRRIIRLASAIALTLSVTTVLYLPVLVVSGLGPLVSNEWTSRSWGSFSGTAESWMRGVPIVILLAVAAGIVAGVIRLARQRRSALVLVLSAVAIPPLFIAVHGVRPFDRAWISLLPLALALAAGGLATLVNRLPRRQQTFATALLALTLITPGVTGRSSIATSDETGRFDDAAAVAGHFAAGLRAGDRIVAPPGIDVPLMFHLRDRTLPPDLFSRPLENATRLLVVESASHPLPRPWRATMLAGGFRPEETISIGEARVTLLTRR